MNKYRFSQLQGPFVNHENIFNKINNFAYTEKIGIQAKPGTICYINETMFEIGKTGILEYDGIRITSLYFTTPTDKNTLIDFILK